MRHWYQWKTSRPPTQSPQDVKSIYPGTCLPDLEDPMEEWTEISKVSWGLSDWCLRPWSCFYPQKLVLLVSSNLNLVALHDVKTEMTLELAHLSLASTRMWPTMLEGSKDLGPGLRRG